MKEESHITKVESGRAEFAYNCVKRIVDEGDDKIQKNYRSIVRRIPQMILSNGLGQTLAFIYSKKKDRNAFKLLYDQLAEYLKSNTTIRIQMPNNVELIEWVISLKSFEYRYVTEEILSFLTWLRKFTEGMIEAEEEE